MRISLSSIKLWVIVASAMCLCACEDDPYVPPVEELHPQYFLNRVETTYTVRKGDTLQAIAFLYDLNPEQFASLNHIVYPYTLRTGQILKLSPRVKVITPPRSIQRQIIKHPSKTYTVVKLQHHGKWQWPTQGRLGSQMGTPLEKKGITIFGKPKQPIYAAADGVVAYAGNGLPGYGHLILIKHADNLLTAYAFNSANLVKEGQLVKAGQHIAQMGQLDSGQWGLHFEMRSKGQVINPMRYLNR